MSAAPECHGMRLCVFITEDMFRKGSKLYDDSSRNKMENVGESSPHVSTQIPSQNPVFPNLIWKLNLTSTSGHVRCPAGTLHCGFEGVSVL